VFSHDGDGDDHGVRRADTTRAHAVPRIVSPRRHGRRNRHQICYIVYNRVANKSINSLTVNGFNLFASTTSPPDPFGRVYPRPIGRIHISHAVKGANGTTMVVMLWIVEKHQTPVIFYSRNSTESTLHQKHNNHNNHHHGGAVCPSYGVGSMDTPDQTRVTSSEGVGRGGWWKRFN